MNVITGLQDTQFSSLELKIKAAATQHNTHPVSGNKHDKQLKRCQRRQSDQGKDLCVPRVDSHLMLV